MCDRCTNSHVAVKKRPYEGRRNDPDVERVDRLYTQPHRSIKMFKWPGVQGKARYRDIDS